MRTVMGRDPANRKHGQTRRLVVLLALVMAVLATACADDGEASRGGGPTGDAAAPGPDELAEDQTLRIHAFFRPPTFDPTRQATASSGGNALGRQYTEALLKPRPQDDQGGEPDVTGAAAERYDVSPDGLTYTFHLRPDGRFNDGRPVTAADFVYGWRRVIDPRLAAPFASVFAGVVQGGEEVMALGAGADDAVMETALDGLGMRAVDDSTFEVVLAEPAPYFKWIATLHQGAPIRRDVIEVSGTEGWATEPATLVTNGPFMLEEVAANTISFVANPHFSPRPRLTRIEASFDIDRAPLWTRYLNDEVDISNGPPRASYESALADPRFAEEILTETELATNWLQFNAAKAPFDNAGVRLAFAQAIDRQAYAKVSSQPVVPLSSYIPEGMPGHEPALGDVQAFDATKARSTLAASGVDPGELAGVTILTSGFQESDAVFFQDQLRENLGVEVAVESVGDNASRNARVRDGDYQMLTSYVGHAAAYPDPQDFFSALVSSSNENLTGWSNAEYDRLVQEANRTVDEADRLDLYRQAQAILVQEAPAAFLGQIEGSSWIKPWVRGITTTAVDTAFWPGDVYSSTIWIAEH